MHTAPEVLPVDCRRSGGVERFPGRSALRPGLRGRRQRRPARARCRDGRGHRPSPDVRRAERQAPRAVPDGRGRRRLGDPPRPPGRRGAAGRLDGGPSSGGGRRRGPGRARPQGPAASPSLAAAPARSRRWPQAVVEGLVLGGFRDLRFKTEEPDSLPLAGAELVLGREPDADVEAAARRGALLAACTNVGAGTVQRARQPVHAPGLRRPRPRARQRPAHVGRGAHGGGHRVAGDGVSSVAWGRAAWSPPGSSSCATSRRGPATGPGRCWGSSARA